MAEPFDDDPLVRSLREPGTPAELADQDRYVAMFRETRGGGTVSSIGPGSPRRSGGRAVRRLGAGTTLSIALAMAGGGVAAAYTANLPEPLQELAHTVLGPVNVPPPTEPRPERVATAPQPDPSPSAPETPSATPDAQPTVTTQPSKPVADDTLPSAESSPTSEPTDSPSETPTATPSSTPTTTPTATATPTATPTPTTTPTSTPTSTPSTPTGPVAASVSISGSARRVDYAASPVLSGVVRSEDGDEVVEVQVALMQLDDGVWRRVGSDTTDEDGAVSISAPPVYANTSLRLKTDGARSTTWRVRMRPEVNLASAVDGDTVTIVASTVGGQPGDVIRLSGRRDGVRVTLATGILGPDGSVTFQVQQATRRSRYAALLEASPAHTADRSVLVVVKPKTPTGDDEETPSPSP